MITSVIVENFKNIRHQEISLEPLTVFVGPNGSGKTSVLEAIYLALAAARKPEKVFTWRRHCDWLYSRGGSGDLSVLCSTTVGNVSVNATSPSDFPPRQTHRLGGGIWEFTVSRNGCVVHEETLGNGPSLAFFHLNAERLAERSYSDRDPPRPGPRGHGVASVKQKLVPLITGYEGNARKS